MSRLETVSNASAAPDRAGGGFASVGFVIDTGAADADAGTVAGLVAVLLPPHAVTAVAASSTGATARHILARCSALPMLPGTRAA